MTLDVKARTATIIYLESPPHVYLQVGFESTYLWHTEHVTLRLGRQVAARFRPGTSHRDRALETAVELSKTALAACVEAEGHWSFDGMVTAYAEAVEAHPYCTLWDGRDDE